MDDLSHLTPEENRQLRELLRADNASPATVKVRFEMPRFARYIGKVGKFALYAAITVNLIDEVCDYALIPKKVEEVYTYYQPKLAMVYDFACRVIEDIEMPHAAPHEPPVNRDYLAMQMEAILESTWHPTPPPNMTVVASTGLFPREAPEILRASDLVKSPSEWA